jgi:hypothetical protein
MSASEAKAMARHSFKPGDLKVASWILFVGEMFGFEPGRLLLACRQLAEEARLAELHAGKPSFATEILVRQPVIGANIITPEQLKWAERFFEQVCSTDPLGGDYLA